MGGFLVDGFKINPGPTQPEPQNQRIQVFHFPMGNSDTAADAGGSKFTQANAENRYEVTAADLPLHCPMDSMSLWNSHPRVYLPIEETGTAKCPYCGADYVLKD